MAISANSGEYRSTIGVDQVYIAEVNTDTVATWDADTPEYLAPVAEIKLEPNVSSETQYADDGPYDVMTGEGETKITVTLTGVPAEMLAKLTGEIFDPATGRVSERGATAPWIALSFRSQKSDGGYRYYQFAKGRFTKPKQSAVTRGEKPDPQTVELEYSAVKTTHPFSMYGSVTDGFKVIWGDSGTTNFSATGWFTSVQTPSTSAPSALALSSSVPTDGATGISVSANQTLTFNNALNSAATANVVLLAATGAVKVTATITIDTARKVITIDPGSSLSGTTEYIIAYAVTDIYAQTLSGAINFTTV